MPPAIDMEALPQRREHHAMLHGMLWVALYVLIGKAAGAAKEVVVAWRYGVDAGVDAYVFLFNLINWPVSLWLGVLTSALIPVLVTARDGASDEWRRFSGELLGRTLLVGAVLAVATGWSIATLLHSPLSGLPPASLQAAADLVLPLALLLPLGLLVGLFSVMMLAQARHANTLLECIPAVVTGTAVAVAGGSGVVVLAWATLAGFACHAVCLAAAVRSDLGRPLFSGQATHWRAFFAGFGIMLAAQVLTSLTVLVDQFFAARVGEGALATLNYAQRILALVLGLGATAVARAVIPVLARDSVADRGRLQRLTLHWVGIVFVGGLVAIGAGWWLGPTAVRLLFERGAFGPQDSVAVAAVLQAGLLQLPFNLAAVILFYALVGRRRFVALAWIAAVCLAAKCVANAAFVPRWGIDGIMYGTALSYALLMAMYLYTLRATAGSDS